jgi:hypothetical protein
MQCESFKKGTECAFMTKKGCNFNGGRCHSVVDSCQGCSRAATFDDGVFCTVSPNPASKWARGNCNFATHLERKAVEQTMKVNPLKASKRAAASKK